MEKQIGKMIRLKPGNPEYKGCYERLDKSGTLTYYVKVQGNYVKVGVADSGKPNNKITPVYVKNFRAEIMNKDLDEILPRGKRKKRGKCMTVDEAYELHRGYLINKNIKRDTTRNLRPYVSKYKHHIKPYIGHKRLDEVTPDTVRKMKPNWEKSGIGLTTQRDVMATISAIYATAQANGYTGDNPMKGLNKKDRITHSNRRLRFLTVPEMEGLLAMVKKNNPRAYHQACLAAYGGLRLSEILRLRPIDVNLENGIITVHTVKHSTSTSKVRYVQMIPELLQVVSEMNNQFRGTRTEPYFVRYHDSAYNKAVKDSGLNEGIDPKDQVNRVGFHTLRHSYASQMLQSGANIKQVQQALGHTDLASTMIYLHVSDQAMIDAGEKLAEFRSKSINSEVTRKRNSFIVV